MSIAFLLNRFGAQCPGWVKRRNARREQMFSAVHPTTDIAQKGRHVRSVPKAEVTVSAKPFGGLYGHPQIE
jgi:hypothetical protein